MSYSMGPWHVGEGGSVFSADGYEVMDPSQGPFLSGKWLKNDGPNKGHWGRTPGASKERQEEEMEANGQLIAAAPEMLAALKCFLDAGVFTDCGRLGKKWEQDVRKLIAKAERPVEV